MSGVPCPDQGRCGSPTHVTPTRLEACTRMAQQRAQGGSRRRWGVLGEAPPASAEDPVLRQPHHEADWVISERADAARRVNSIGGLKFSPVSGTVLSEGSPEEIGLSKVYVQRMEQEGYCFIRDEDENLWLAAPEGTEALPVEVSSRGIRVMENWRPSSGYHLHGTVDSHIENVKDAFGQVQYDWRDEHDPDA